MDVNELIEKLQELPKDVRKLPVMMTTHWGYGEDEVRSVLVGKDAKGSPCVYFYDQAAVQANPARGDELA